MDTADTYPSIPMGEAAFVPGTSKSSGNTRVQEIAAIRAALPLGCASQGPDCFREK
jgi:hypothetical protein